MSGERPSPVPPQGTASAEGVRVAIAWIVVAVPAAWGVAQVVIKSAALFR
ncbi:MAG: hypothetical protein HY275_01395 [Gemmatimonadetes bacterium]|nr:hypothetical protein [Gemmatimonadota bacterium]